MLYFQQQCKCDQNAALKRSQTCPNPNKYIQVKNEAE